jgi:c-di-GMP-binding flagellar brake protein YcgR
VYYDVVLGERLQMMNGGMVCVCDVQEIFNNGRLLISSPQGAHELSVPLLPGETIELTYNSGGGQYTFKAKVNGRVHRDGVLYYVIVFASMIRKSQRRSYARVELSIPFGVRTLASGAGANPSDASEILQKIRDANPSLAETAPLYETTTIDLSGGGVAFASSTPLPPGTLILCEMIIDGQPFHIESLVTFMREDPARDPKYKISAQFMEIDVKQRKKLIKYLMDQEIRILRLTR